MIKIIHKNTIPKPPKYIFMQIYNLCAWGYISCNLYPLFLLLNMIS